MCIRDSPITEFNENFKGKRIQVLWPDTGKWYNADVIKVNVKKRTAKLFYVDSEEKEDINLYEAMLNMEVSWPYKGGSVGKTPAAADKKRKQRDESTSASESASEDDAPRAKKKTGAVAARRAQIKKQQKQRNAGPAGPSDATRRLIAEKLKAVMVVASGELNATDAKSASDPERVADDVERAAHVLFAEDVKKYNDKARSLHFNLNHPKNHALRARVQEGPHVGVAQQLREMRCSMNVSQEQSNCCAVQLCRAGEAETCAARQEQPLAVLAWRRRTKLGIKILRA